MSSGSTPPMPAGQSPPFAVITPQDHAAWILIATALGLACFLFFCAIRILIRSLYSHGFDLDDYALYAATALGIIQSSIVLGACSKGLGKAVDLVSFEAQDHVQKLYYTSNLFFIMAVGLSKISVVCFLGRISSVSKHRLVFNIAMGLIVTWTVGSLLAIALQCDLRHPWISINEECPGIVRLSPESDVRRLRNLIEYQRRRWEIICALDITSEVAIVGLVIFLVSGLQTSMSSKATVVSIFSVRLFIIVFVAFRLDTFDQAGYSTSPFLLEAPFIAWTQSELTFSLISATVPTFQNFLRNLSTGFGGVGPAEGRYGYGYGSNSRSRNQKENSMSYQMSKMRSANNRDTLEKPDQEQNRRLPHTLPKDSHGIYVGPGSSAIVHRNGGEATVGETTSIGSDESRRMMIRKDVQWTVRTEDPP